MSAGDTIQIGSDLLLVHEGTADRHILGEMMRRLSITGYQPLNLEGQTNRRRYFKGLAFSPRFKVPVPGSIGPVRSLAIVVDAEENATATFAGLRDALVNAGLPAPDAPGQITTGPLRVGIFLVPDNVSAGKIETLCLRSVEDDPAWKCLDGFFRCVEENGGTLPVNTDKARAQAFLATRSQPDLPVGLAALEGYWNVEGPAFAPLAEFLRTLAEP